MLGEIDQLGGLAYAANGGFLDGVTLADQSDDAAVVVGIHLAVEEIDSGDFHGFDNGIDFGRVAAFGKLGTHSTRVLGMAEDKRAAVGSGNWRRVE